MEGNVRGEVILPFGLASCSFSSSSSQITQSLDLSLHGVFKWMEGEKSGEGEKEKLCS